MINLSVVSNRPLVRDEIVNGLKSVRGVCLSEPFTETTRPKTSSARIPHVLILDAGTGGPDFSRQLCLTLAGKLAPRIILISDKGERDVLLEALRMGVSAVLLRPFSTCELTDAVRVAYDGGLYLTPSLVRLLFAGSPQVAPGQKTPPQPLTSRERQILNLQAEGFPYKQIADRLHISEHTVSNHLYAIRQKLGVHSAIEAIKIVYHRNEPPRL